MTACTRTANLSSASASPTAPPRVDFELIRTLLGRGLIDRWEQWQPACGLAPDAPATHGFALVNLALAVSALAAAALAGLAIRSR